MAIKFETKAEAEAEVTRLNTIPPEIFCPLYGDSCNDNCPCYQQPRFHEHLSYRKDTANIFWVYPANCDNAMFFNRCQGGC